MKISKIIKEIFQQLFPDCLAYTNFIMMLAFLLITIHYCIAKEPLYVLVSAIGTLYCMNEWDRRMRIGQRMDNRKDKERMG